MKGIIHIGMQQTPHTAELHREYHQFPDLIKKFGTVWKEKSSQAQKHAFWWYDASPKENFHFFWSYDRKGAKAMMDMETASSDLGGMTWPWYMIKKHQSYFAWEPLEVFRRKRKTVHSHLACKCCKGKSS